MTNNKKWCLIFTVLVVALIMAFSCQVQAITLQEYLNAVRYEVDGDSGMTNDPLSDREITTWVNGGRNLIAAISGCLQKDTIIATVTGQATYLLPSDFLKLKGFVTPPMQVASDLSMTVQSAQSKGPEEMGVIPTGPGTTEEWLQWGTDTARVYVNPTPLGVYDIYVLYSAAPDTMIAMATSCDLPRAYQEVVIQYAASKAYRHMGESAKATEAMGLFNSWLQALMATLSETRTEVPSGQ